MMQGKHGSGPITEAYGPGRQTLVKAMMLIIELSAIHRMELQQMES